MDRLNGCDLLSACIDAGPFSADRAVPIVIALLDALDALHARGVIHRDLKTSNVFLVVEDDGGEQIKLLDLGFAKVAHETEAHRAKVMIGTPLYTSPEQYADPTTVDPRADLFSLGVVMFEILTGLSPYQFTSKMDLLKKVVLGELERHPQAERAEIRTGSTRSLPAPSHMIARSGLRAQPRCAQLSSRARRRNRASCAASSAARRRQDFATSRSTPRIRQVKPQITWPS